MLSDQQSAPTTSRHRPRSLLTDRAPDSERERRSGVYDVSPIVDLDDDDDLSVRSMPKVINFSAEVNRCDGDTVKRNGEYFYFW